MRLGDLDLAKMKIDVELFRIFGFQNLFERLQEVIDSCPTINPEDLHPKGKWIDNPSDGIWTTTCSNCGVEKPQHEHTKYCSDCGADMRDRANMEV